MYFAKQYITTSMICIHFLLFQSIRSLTSYAPVTFGWTICLLLDCTQLPASLLFACHPSPVVLHSVFASSVEKKFVPFSWNRFLAYFPKVLRYVGGVRAAPFLPNLQQQKYTSHCQICHFVVHEEHKRHSVAITISRMTPPPAKISRSSWPCLN